MDNLSLGEFLKTNRESLKISIEEVSHNLKIKPRYIIALEQDSFNLMTEHPHFAGFVKSYAKMLSIEDNIIEEYLKNTTYSYDTKNNKHPLLNLNNEQTKNPSKDDLINAILIFTMIYLLLISFSQFKTQNLAPNLTITDLINNQLNQAE
jgi:cytoskeleton protein RodZ